MLEPFRRTADLNELGNAKLNSRPVLQFATSYRDRGMSVIPLTGKKPAIGSWKKYQTHLPTRVEMNEWFGGKNPKHSNIGIVTGRVSGLIGIDCDSEQTAIDWLNSHPRSPLVVRTGRGGAHIYYRIHPVHEIGNRVRLGGLKIDVRGEAGYLVAPPSRHPNGRIYEWTSWDDFSLDDIPVIDPTWIEYQQRPTDHSTRQIRNAPKYIRSIVARSGEGGHNTTFRAACILRDAGLSEAEALAELVDWNLSGNAIPPWSTQDLLHKVVQAFRLNGDSR